MGTYQKFVAASVGEIQKEKKKKKRKKKKKKKKKKKGLNSNEF